MSGADDILPELDMLEDAPHPRATPHVYGHDAAEAALLAAASTGRMHHAWLLTGPQGIGKASLAWRTARYLLGTPRETGDSLFGASEPPTSLATDPDDPAVRRILAGTDQRLFVLRRAWNTKTKPKPKPYTEIRVDDVRKLRHFFAMSIPDGGGRVVIVDSADEMNNNAANALLKSLEEPPPDTVFLLLAHQPGRLLPTIRSRCRVLRLSPLGPQDMGAALAQIDGAPVPAEALGPLTQLAEGSVRAALAMRAAGGPKLYGQIITLLGSLPRLDRAQAMGLATLPAGVAGAERLALLTTLAERALAQIARQGALGRPLPETVPGEAAIRARLAPTPQAARAWADAATTLPAMVRKGVALNLDPSVMLLDMFTQLQATARATQA